MELPADKPLFSLVEEGSDDCPLLLAIGVDRFGRLWSQDGRTLTLLGELGG